MILLKNANPSVLDVLATNVILFVYDVYNEGALAYRITELLFYWRAVHVNFALVYRLNCWVVILLAHSIECELGRAPDSDIRHCAPNWCIVLLNCYFILACEI